MRAVFFRGTCCGSSRAGGDGGGGSASRSNGGQNKVHTAGNKTYHPTTVEDNLFCRALMYVAPSQCFVLPRPAVGRRHVGASATNHQPTSFALSRLGLPLRPQRHKKPPLLIVVHRNK